MTNIVQFPTPAQPRITTGSHRDGLARDNFAERVIEQVRQYQSLPAWVIADHDLNRDSHILMSSGWRFECAVESVRKVYFSHPRVKTTPPRFLDEIEALQMQKILGAVKP